MKVAERNADAENTLPNSRVGSMTFAPIHSDVASLSIMTTKEAALYLRLSAGRLALLRSIGGGPTFIAQSSRKCLYRKTDLDRWLDDRARQNNSGSGQ